MGCTDAKRVPGIKAKAKVHCKALFYSLSKASDAGGCFKKGEKSVGRDCGLPGANAERCGTGDEDADGDQEKVGSTEKWEHSKKKIYLKQNILLEMPLIVHLSCCVPLHR